LGSGGIAPHPGHFTPRERAAGTHCIGLGGPKSQSGLLNHEVTPGIKSWHV